jgi:hypothetical protein
MPSPAMTARQAGISAVIVLVIGLHAVPLLSYQGNRQTRWPFLAWAMYAASVPPGPITTNQRRIIGVTAAGDTTELTYAVIGVSGPTLTKSYLRPLSTGDSAAAQRLFERVNARRRERPFDLIRLEGERATLTDTGVAVERYPTITYHRAAPAPR